MNQETFSIQPIGYITSPFDDPEGMPIQPAGARGVEGSLELLPELEPGLKDLDGFSHLILLYWFHRAGPAKLTVKPFLDAESHGIFATRAPTRPNPLGLSVLRLKQIQGPVLHLVDVDILNNTPVVDIKPFVPGFDDPYGPMRTGWLKDRQQGAQSAAADSRFK